MGTEVLCPAQHQPQKGLGASSSSKVHGTQFKSQNLDRSSTGESPPVSSDAVPHGLSEGQLLPQLLP